MTLHCISSLTTVDGLQVDNPLKKLWFTTFIIDPGQPEDARPFNHNVHHLILDLQCTQPYVALCTTILMYIKEGWLGRLEVGRVAWFLCGLLFACVVLYYFLGCVCGRCSVFFVFFFL